LFTTPLESWTSYRKVIEFQRWELVYKHKLLQKYKGVGRSEHWLTEDNEKFAKNSQEYGELNCIDRFTTEELREMQLKYR